MCDVTEEQVSHTKNFSEKGIASAKEHGGHRRRERSKEGRCGQGRWVLGTDFAELCKPRTGFHLEQAAGGPEQGKTFHTHCPHQPLC